MAHTRPVLGHCFVWGARAAAESMFIKSW